jgi:ABC transporter transmembrane region
VRRRSAPPGRSVLGLHFSFPHGPQVVSQAPALPVRDVLRRFWADARPFRRWLPLSLLLISAGVAIETAEICLFKLVVDEVLVPGELGPLVWIGAACAGLLVLGGAVSLADDALGTWLGGRFLLSMRTRVFGHLLTLSPDALDRRRLGDVLTRLGGDVAAIENFVLFRRRRRARGRALDRLLRRRPLPPAMGSRARLADRGAAVLRHRAPTRRRRRRGRRSRPPPARPAPTSSSRRCPPATTRTSASGGGGSPEASASGSRTPAPCSPTRRC